MSIRSWLWLSRPVCCFALLACALAGQSPAADRPTPGVVSHIKVVSDKVEDVSSLEAWKRSFLKPGMTERQKALAIWETVVKFRHQDLPPLEYIDHEDQVHDPIRAFNVYGYSLCSGTAAYVEALARYAGMEARGWGITGHSVPEIKIDGRWAMFDASLINWFQNADGTIAGVEQISKEVADWYARNPGYKNNRDKLYQMMASGGWRKGPAVLAGSATFDDNGWQPAATHAWGDTILEYGTPKDQFLYDYSAAIGYEVNIQLRPGEVLTRSWSNSGLHVNASSGGGAPHALSLSTNNPAEQLRYCRRYGDLAPGRIGNGTHVYDVPVSDPALPSSALVADNLTAGARSPALQAQDSSRSGVLVLRMPSSYVYLGGSVSCKAVVPAGGRIEVQLSDNNGLSWKEVGTIKTSGDQSLDLKPLILRRYDYRLKLTLHGQGTGLDGLKIRHDIQHSQRPLPALAQGENKITFSAGPQEGTITVQGSTNVKNRSKNLYFMDFQPQLSDKLATEPFIQPRADGASITFPVTTPGEMTRLRIGTASRARDARDVWLVQASFDDGKTFREIGKLKGPYQGMGHYLVYEDVPAGTRSALVRFSGTERNTCVLFDERISADYKEPQGGFAPVKITYTWEEAGQPRQDVHVARSPSETYTIRCSDRPIMKAITLQLVR
jgi:hypothetical protein